VRSGLPDERSLPSLSLPLLEALADPKHADHTDAKQWSADYDPNTFDELPIKFALGRIANRRNAARSRASIGPMQPWPPRRSSIDALKLQRENATLAIKLLKVNSELRIKQIYCCQWAPKFARLWASNFP
jgi:hypothetical protein